MSDEQQHKAKTALDQAVEALVKSVAEVGEAKIAADEHIRDRDNFVHSAHHRRVQAQGRAVYDKAVDAYVRFRRSSAAETTSG